MANKIFTLKIRRVDTADGEEEEGSAKKELGLFDSALYTRISVRYLLLLQVSLDLTICTRSLVHNIKSRDRWSVLSDLFQRLKIGFISLEYSRENASVNTRARKKASKQANGSWWRWKRGSSDEEEEGEILLCIHNFPEIKTAPRQSRLKLSRFFYVLLFNHGRARC